jgi:hypothetical protein
MKATIKFLLLLLLGEVGAIVAPTYTFKFPIIGFLPFLFLFFLNYLFIFIFLIFIFKKIINVVFHLVKYTCGVLRNVLISILRSVP